MPGLCSQPRAGRRRSKRAMEAGHALSSPLGRITIASEAIAQIVAETALECYGVVGMRARCAGSWLVPAARPRGIEIGRDGDEVTIDLHVVVEYGLNLAEVASSVRNRVAYEVERLTGLPVARGRGARRRRANRGEVTARTAISSSCAASSPRRSPRSRRAAAASTTSTSIPSPTATPARTSR